MPNRYRTYQVILILYGSLVSCVHGFVRPASNIHSSSNLHREPTFLPNPSRSNIVAVNLFRSKTNESKTLKKKAKTAQTKNQIIEVESHADWMELLENDDDTEFCNDDDDDDQSCQQQKKFTAVTFTAAWCKFCQKFQMKWKRKLVQPYQDVVQFASVEFGANKKLCQSLHIQALPTVQFYNRKGQLMNSFPCGPKGFGTAKDILKKYVAMSSAELELEALAWEQNGKQQATRGSSSMTAKRRQSKISTPKELGISVGSDESHSSTRIMKSNDDVSDNGENDNKSDDDSFEPSLYLRKRDRFKRKLRNSIRRSPKKE